MPRYRYINTTPVVFTQEVVNGKTWTPEPGEEADFDHEIDHPFLLLVIGNKEPQKNDEVEIKPPAKIDVATEQDIAINGEDLKES